MLNYQRVRLQKSLDVEDEWWRDVGLKIVSAKFSAATLWGMNSSTLKIPHFEWKLIFQPLFGRVCVHSPARWNASTRWSCRSRNQDRWRNRLGRTGKDMREIKPQSGENQQMIKSCSNSKKGQKSNAGHVMTWWTCVDFTHATAPWPSQEWQHTPVLSLMAEFFQFRSPLCSIHVYTYTYM